MRLPSRHTRRARLIDSSNDKFPNDGDGKDNKANLENGPSRVLEFLLHALNGIARAHIGPILPQIDV